MGTTSNLAEAAQEAAQVVGLNKVAVSELVLSRVKDHGLLHTAGLIGGKWADVASDKSTFEVRNPATGAVIATMPRMRADETRAAIAAAHAVWPQWRSKTARERAAVLRKWHDLILERKYDIAAIMTLECGKPTGEALAEIASGAASVDWFAGEAVRVCGDVLEPPLRDRRMLVIKQPVGVVGAITPWNFPMSMITRKVAPALAAGCTVRTDEEGRGLRRGGGVADASLRSAPDTELLFHLRCFKEETFGPLIPLFRFRSDEEAVLLANTTEYGLAAYFYTRDLARAWKVAEELEFGMIGLNEVAITSEVAPFGGVKASGLGREQSKYGLAEFLDVKLAIWCFEYTGEAADREEVNDVVVLEEEEAEEEKKDGKSRRQKKGGMSDAASAAAASPFLVKSTDIGWYGWRLAEVKA
ncbi:hypothetical protein VOLCADRAFT_93805 [Volvox carteri f. nagariensis]|uniref:Aldehyde dehydrogenase domain-containing protein n=1 Tax=Volvox carteri f. nagariensis TaxID=3068 RepID=D8U339_VOLCA|nr:uncharacterized protein VOLCADRAFT_93805 [Volvox carteri f. nagariensis]EFJ45913.1 hypothetical protein VOLCADRAFT_93805 [Volvox carteri f. nagariensis]|eukprot:XP_002952991.1 hypothetical protein VOLCADRAFT_93805 [Volvox carteri f. nagariensis]